jgi:quercetin dioxygenase-like cupin family protein
LEEEILFERGATLVRRLRLEPGEELPWHVDPWHRLTVVLRGEALELEYRDTGERRRITVRPEQVDWDEPTDRVHRARNVGGPYEEVTVFFRDRAGDAHQPRV